MLVTSIFSFSCNDFYIQNNKSWTSGSCCICLDVSCSALPTNKFTMSHCFCYSPSQYQIHGACSTITFTSRSVLLQLKTKIVLRQTRMRAQKSISYEKVYLKATSLGFYCILNRRKFTIFDSIVILFEISLLCCLFLSNK